jgi:DNA-binding NarL/FixJ family response regulator
MRRPATEIAPHNPAHRTMTGQITIAIVDDHAIVRQGICTFLEIYSDFFIVGNATIAAKLAISEKTVKVHVSNILSKLHMLDRTQAAVNKSPRTLAFHRQAE